MAGNKFIAYAFLASAATLAACSGSSNPPAPPFPSDPSATPSARASATVSPGASGSPAATPSGGAPSSSPSNGSSPGNGSTAGPTPTASPSPPPIVADLTSLVVCAQQSNTCADDLDPLAGSGEEVAVLVKGVTGTLSFSNTGGPSVATITSQLYAQTSHEYEVFYKAATASTTTDSLTISDSGTQSSLTLPVSIIAPGGPADFSMATTSGSPCPGDALALSVQNQPAGSTVSVTASNTAAIPQIQDYHNTMFTLTFAQTTASSYVTASDGSTTIVYPADIPTNGFSSICPTPTT